MRSQEFGVKLFFNKGPDTYRNKEVTIKTLLYIKYCEACSTPFFNSVKDKRFIHIRSAPDKERKTPRSRHVCHS